MIDIALGKPLLNSAGLHSIDCRAKHQAWLCQLDCEW